MSRRRQRRFSLAPSPERPVPASTPSSSFSPLSTRSRPKSWSPRASILRRNSAPACAHPSPPKPSSPLYVPVRVLDFVTVPPERHAPPALALGPVDTAARPPSYDLASAVRRSTRAVAATQTAPDWDAEEVDRVLDEECASEVSDDEHPTPDTVRHPYGPPVFMIKDNTHVNKLVNIVNAVPPPPPEEERDEATDTGAAAAAQQRALVTSIDGPFSNASSSEMSTTSSCIASTASPRSGSVASARATSASFGSSSEKSDPPPPQPALVAMPPTPPRRKLLNNKVPSPVKYTFRPPVPAPPKPLSPLPPAGAARCEDRGEAPGVASVVPVGLPYRHRRQSSGGLSAVSSGPPSAEPVTLAQVKGVVENVDPTVVLKMASPPINPPLLAMSIFRKTGKRESDESAQSSSTEYYEDEYTKFIEKKSGSPLRLRGKPYLSKMISNDSWGSKGGRMDCRSNSTVSVATSDDEYHPILGRLSNV